MSDGRTIEDALAHAEKWKDVPDVTIVVDPLGGTFVTDLILLADEVKRLRVGNARIFPLEKGQ